jgi:hypothetical protein
MNEPSSFMPVSVNERYKKRVEIISKKHKNLRNGMYVELAYMRIT